MNAATPSTAHQPELSLGVGLQQLEQLHLGSSYVVGAAGHLLLGLAEESRIVLALDERVLPEILAHAAGRRIVLLAGLAPGADVLFLRTAARWLTARAIPYECFGLLAVPEPWVLADWIEKSVREGYTMAIRDHERLAAELRAARAVCSSLVRLYDEDETLIRAALRQHQYGLLGALLAQLPDALIAMLRSDEPRLPGGTAETVAWWNNPQAIPSEFRMLGGNRSADERRLHLIDPAPDERQLRVQAARREAEAILAAESAQAAGNDLLCNDIVFRALRQLSDGAPVSPQLAQLRVLSLARIGSTELALKEYEQLAPPAPARNASWLSLLGRLRKDLGLSLNQRTHLLAAAAAYAQAQARDPCAYHAINAAATLVLAGELGGGRQQAAAARAAALAEIAADETTHYYRAATLAESALILGDAPAVASALAEADRYLRNDVTRRTSTRHQLHCLCRALALDTTVLATLSVPPLILLRRLGAQGAAGVVPATLQLPGELVPEASIYAGLCDAFDLTLCELLLARGLRVHLCLPYRPELMIEFVLDSHGDEWAQRLHKVFTGAQTLSAGRGFLATELDWAAQEVTHRSFGLALQQAARQGGGLQVIEVQPQEQGALLRPLPPLPEEGLAELASAQLCSAETPLAPPPGRRMVGLIFADFAGFQRIKDAQLPTFWNQTMRAIAQLLDRHGAHVLLRQTWGDALHIVTDDARTAGELLSDIQELMAPYAPTPGNRRDDALSGLKLRMSAHYAPAYEGYDPVQNVRTYYGTQLSLTARIEPVTPPGMIYATESLAAQLAVEAPGRFALEYAGELELAKHFGAYRLYVLHRLAAGKPPD